VRIVGAAALVALEHIGDSRLDVIPSASSCPLIHATIGLQYDVSKSTTGKWRILPVWINVSASYSSSSVPKPPGKITKPSDGRTKHTLRA
jgi:hypothetical protein